MKELAERLFRDVTIWALANNIDVELEYRDASREGKTIISNSSSSDQTISLQTKLYLKDKDDEEDPQDEEE